MMTYKVKDKIAENLLCRFHAEVLFEDIHPVLLRHEKIILDFEGVGAISSFFFQNSFGRLLGEFSVEQLQDSLEVINMGLDSRALLSRVVKNAANYFEEKELLK